MENFNSIYMKKTIPTKATQFKYMNFLSMIYITFLMAATVMAYKVVRIGSITEPGSTLIYTFTFFIGNVYSELYGAGNAKKLLWQSIISGYLFAILITTVNAFPSPADWNLKEPFDIVLGHVLRFTNSGVIGYLLSSFFNIYLMTRWKYKLNGRYFWFRSLLASSLSEGMATFIAGFMTFWGMIPTISILMLMFNALVFKIIYGFFAVWPTSFIAYILKRKEYPINEELFLNTSYIVKN